MMGEYSIRDPSNKIGGLKNPGADQPQTSSGYVTGKLRDIGRFSFLAHIYAPKWEMLSVC
jgi:hypothetical protein